MPSRRRKKLVIFQLPEDAKGERTMQQLKISISQWNNLRSRRLSAAFCVTESCTAAYFWIIISDYSWSARLKGERARIRRQIASLIALMALEWSINGKEARIPRRLVATKSWQLRLKLDRTHNQPNASYAGIREMCIDDFFFARHLCSLACLVFLALVD